MQHVVRTAGRRRRLSLAVVAAMVGAALWAWTLGAGAAVTNPGPITVTFHDGVLATGLGSFSPLEGTATGTVDSSGNITLPQANISFDEFDVDITNPLPLTAHIVPVANSDFTGNIDPDTGLTTLSGSLITNLQIATLGLTNCPLGPLAINLSTATAGGVPYDDATGEATGVDNTFIIPAIPVGQAGCGSLEGAINDALTLPSVPGAATLTQPMTFSPTLIGSTTTTAGPTTTTTVAPTTTTAAPTTTTTAAPTTTTTAGPTTTTTAPATTTTTVPKPCKPGWGHGDKNHCHSGPPGHGNGNGHGNGHDKGHGHWKWQSFWKWIDQLTWRHAWLGTNFNFRW